MQRLLLSVIIASLTPMSALAAPASFSAAQSLVAANSSPGNSYVVGVSVVLTAPVAGDFAAFGGSIITAAPVAGDNLLLAGSIRSRSSVSGDFRAIGGSIDIDEPVAGDLFAVGFSVRDSGRARGSVFIIAANTTLSSGASGPVSIYGNNISLAGDFAGDVTIFSMGHVSLAPGTTIRGKLSYEAPETATIPDSATILGGVTYTNASYLPDTSTSRALAFVSIGFFLIARVVGALILAGLLAGLFPKFAEATVHRVSKMRIRTILLALLLGFAIFVATPVVIALLLLTFVGIGLALMLSVLYALLFLLACMYVGIFIGGLLARRFLNREQVLWHDGVIGMTIFSLITLVPFIGVGVAALLMLFCAGVLLQIFFHFAFPHGDS